MFVIMTQRHDVTICVQTLCARTLFVSRRTHQNDLRWCVIDIGARRWNAKHSICNHDIVHKETRFITQLPEPE